MAPTSPHKFHSPLSTKSDAVSKSLEFNRRSLSGTHIASKPSTIVDQPRSFNPSSPSEIGRRNSVVCKERFEQKENDKDLNSVKRVASPSVSKSTKNFMSPTISAAIKFTPSPRKKILTERNENHLVSSNPCLSDDSNDLRFKSDVKFNTLCNPEDTKPEADQNSPPFNEDVKVPSKATLRSPIFSDSDSELEDGKGTISRTLSSKSLYDQDASLLLPYDPKTNCLSPRPRYRCYKPNLRLDDDYISEESEEMVSDDSSEEFEDFVSWIESVEKEEDTRCWPSDTSDSTDDAPEVKSIETQSEAKRVHLDSASKSIPTQILEEKCVPWLHSSARSKTTALFLIFLTACLLSMSFTDTPVISSFSTSSPSTFERHLLFTGPYQNPHTSIFTKTNLGGLTKSLQERSLPLLAAASSYISGLIGSFSEIDNMDPTCYGNSTSSLENDALEIFIQNAENGDFAYLEEGEFANAEENWDLANGLEDEDDRNEEDEDFVNHEGGEFSNVEDGDFPIVVDDVEAGMMRNEVNVEASESEKIQDPKAKEIVDDVETEEAANVEDIEEIAEMMEVEDDYVALESEEDGRTDEDMERVKTEQTKVWEAPEISEASESEQQIEASDPEIQQMGIRILGLDDKHMIVAAILLVVVVATPFTAAASKSRHALTRKTKPPSSKSPHNKTLCETSRSRESLGSSLDFSTTSSPSSFGSFTAYEKMTRKHGEGKTLTPVRRSSRIRSNLTSP